MRKFLLILLFIPLISFGQNFPFEISKDFVKLNDKEKYDFLLEEYKGYKEKGFSFAEEFHNIKGNYEIYKRKDVDLIYENILIYINPYKGTIENLYEYFNETKNELENNDELATIGIRTSFNDLGINLYNNYYKYCYLSMGFEADIFGERLNFKRTGYAYYLYVDGVFYQISINTVDNLDINDVVISIKN
jgi:hypothetical protein